MPASVPSTRPLKSATTVYVRVQCPHCGFEGNEPLDLGHPTGYYYNGHNHGAGGYVLNCNSCGTDFAIEAGPVQDAQHQCLILLGEA